MALRLLRRPEYSQELEELGLTYVGIEYFEDGIPNGVWETVEGRRYLVPGVSNGLEDDPEYEMDMPMISWSDWNRIFRRIKDSLGS